MVRRWLPILALLAATGSSLAEPAPPCPPVRIRWTIRNEEGIYGFLVYRATSRTGPFLRANRAIVRQGTGQSQPGGAAEYSWEDPEAISAGSRFYYVDLVTVRGEKRRLTGVVEKKPCVP